MRITETLIIGIILLALVLPVSAVTDTFYPVDAAILGHNPAGNATFQVIRNGTGTDIARPAGDQYIYLQSLSYADQYDYMQKIGYVLNLSSIDDTAVIQSAKICIWEMGSSSYLGQVNLYFTDGTTDNGNISFVAGDYNSWGSTTLTDTHAFSTGTDKWGNYTFLPGALSYLNLTGNTTVYGRFSWDLNNANTWVTSTYSRAHGYIISGTYNPRMEVTYYIPSTPVANFTSNKTTGTAPTGVQFYDTSENIPTMWNWSFGDGTWFNTTTSSAKNASHTYTYPGTYTISLTVSNSLPGDDTETKTDYLTFVPPKPNAAFSGTPLFGTSPLHVQFTDASTLNATSWSWDFGDGSSENNTDRNPIHTYAADGWYSVCLTATNAYGSDTELKNNYINVAGATYGNHPFLLFRNITDVDGFKNRTEAPWNYWETKVFNSRAYEPNRALWYHICANSGGTGCSAYANQTIAALNTLPNNTYILDAYPYIIAYDLVAGTKDTGETTLTTTIDNHIRDTLAKIADNAYSYLDYNSAGKYQPSNVNYPDRKSREYVAIWMMGEVLHDYDTTGKGLASDPADWIHLGTFDFLVDNTKCTWWQDPGGYAYFWINKTGGKELAGGYNYYFQYYWYTIPRIYSQIHGNIFDVNPEFKLYYMNFLYEMHPSTFLNNHITAGGMMYHGTTIGAWQYLSEEERSWLRWQYANQTEMWSAGIYDHNNWFYEPQEWQYYLLYPNLKNESVYRPTDKNWMNPVYPVMRTGWKETDDWISMTARSLTTGMNQADTHADQMAIEFFSHGDYTVVDGGEVRHLGDFDIRHEAASHTILMFANPRTAFPTIWSQNISANGASLVPMTKAEFINQIDSEAIGYTEGYSAVTSVQTGHVDYQTLESPIQWKRSIVSPMNEYFVVIDRATSGATWLYKSHWSLGSMRGQNRTSYGTRETILNTRVNGTLSLGGAEYNWDMKPLVTEINTSIKTSDVVWNTTNERGTNISLHLFSVPESFVSFYKFMSKLGGYTSSTPIYNHEYTNPTLFFNEPANASTYRITALLPAWETDVNRRTPSELAVTGTGSAMQVDAPTGTTTDYFFAGNGSPATFSTFETDAELVFIRKTNATTVQEYLLVNGTYLNESSDRVFLSTSKLKYISLNVTGQASRKFNVSGSGDPYLYFYEVPTSLNTTMDGVTHANWTMTDATTLRIGASLSTHYFETGDILERDPASSPGEFMYNETGGEPPEPTAIFYAPSTSADGTLRRNDTNEEFDAIRNGEGVNAALTAVTGVTGIGTLTTAQNYSSNAQFGWSADTSSIPDNANITSAWFSVYGTLKDNGIGSIYYTLTDFEPSDPTSLVASDYGNSNDLVYSANQTYSSFSTSGWNYIYFSNLSAINKEGYTSLMIKSQPDIDNSNSSITWASTKASYIQFYETSYGSKIPELNVIWTIPEGEAPAAIINATPTSGTAPLIVSFEDASTGNVTSWLWNFDGENTSIVQDTEWTFEEAGVFNVSLRVENEAGNDTAYQLITATSGIPDASFTSSRTTVRVPGNVTFTDTSSNTPTSWSWYFGDGSANSTDQNLIHAFTRRGIYNVSLNATNADGSDQAYQIVRVIGYDSLQNLQNGDWPYDSNIQAIGVIGVIIIGLLAYWRYKK